MTIVQGPQDFVRESNAIEGINRDPTTFEIMALSNFINLPIIEISDLIHFVAVYQPDAQIRDKQGLNVYVGDHVPPKGGPEILQSLQKILDMGSENPYQQHQQYETLHPFTDGNGRSGRALWLWAMGGYAPLGFLHHWYYQSLSGGR